MNRYEYLVFVEMALKSPLLDGLQVFSKGWWDVSKSFADKLEDIFLLPDGSSLFCRDEYISVLTLVAGGKS